MSPRGKKPEKPSRRRRRRKGDVKVTPPSKAVDKAKGKKRIQKLLSRAGVASRRAAEEMIMEGRVSVNGEIVMDLPFFAHPDKDDIRVDGKPIRTEKPEKKVYILLNKPKGVVSTVSDPEGRPTVADVVKEVPQRVYPVGRLDVDTTGLVLMTNDGELTEYLTHPRYGVEKTYVVVVEGRLGGDQIEQLRNGLYIDGKRTHIRNIKVLRRSSNQTMLEIRIAEGKNREIRRMLLKVGFKVTRLKRIAIGPINDRGLKIGNFRRLSRAEVTKLRKAGEAEKK